MSPRPHTFRVPAGIPAALLRAMSVLVIAVAAGLLIGYPLWQGVAVVAALIGAVLPRTLATWIAAACLPFGMLFAEPSPVRTAIAVAVVHLVHVIGSLSLTVPLRSWVSPRALLPSLRRYAAIQVLAQSVVLGVEVLLGGLSAGPIPWAAPVGAAVLLGATVFAARLLRSGDAETGSGAAG